MTPEIETQAKALANAERGGVDIEGALAAGRSVSTSATQVLIVFPDRVELIQAGRNGSLRPRRAKTTTVQISQISLAQCHCKGTHSSLQLHTADAVIHFDVDKPSGSRLHRLVLELVAAGSEPYCRHR